MFCLSGAPINASRLGRGWWEVEELADLTTPGGKYVRREKVVKGLGESSANEKIERRVKKKT